MNIKKAKITVLLTLIAITSLSYATSTTTKKKISPTCNTFTTCSPLGNGEQICFTTTICLLDI